MAASMRFVYFLNHRKLFNKNDYIFKISTLCIRKYSSKHLGSFKYCVESVRKYDYENYLCSLLLPNTVRSSAFVIRAFNIEISQVRDLVTTPAIGEMRLRFWHDTLNQVFSGKPPDQPVAKELAKVLQKHKLSKAWFQRLIVSRENLLNDKPFSTVKEAEEYCENSVVSVYFLILQALGVNNVHCDHAASHAGKAQGLCNLIRGIPYNASKRRAVLPIELMSKHKISQEDIIHGNKTKNLQDAVYDISTVAHQHLLMARNLSKDVTDNVKSVFLPAAGLQATEKCLENLMKNFFDTCGTGKTCNFHVDMQVATAAYLKCLEKTDFDVFHPRNQKRNNWLPISLMYHKVRNKY